MTTSDLKNTDTKRFKDYEPASLEAKWQAI